VKAIKNLYTTLRHPFIYPLIDFDYITDRQVLAAFRNFNPKGTLKDFIHAAHPKDEYSKKYRNMSKITVDRIAVFGRQILEGLIYLRDIGIPNGHLHTGNVIIEDGICRLTDYENAIINIEPHLFPHQVALLGKSDPDVVSLACVLYEMAIGDEPDPRDPGFIPSICPSIVRKIIEPILTGTATVTLEDLHKDPFFTNAKLRDDFRYEIENLVKPKVESKAKEFLKSLTTVLPYVNVQEYQSNKEKFLKYKVIQESPKKRKSSLSPASSSVDVLKTETPRSTEKEKEKVLEDKTSPATSPPQSPPSIRAASPPPKALTNPIPTTNPISATPAITTPPPKVPSSPTAPNAPAIKPPPKGPPPPAKSPPKAGTERKALLSSIEGFKGGLKKAVTKDRSAPLLKK